MPTNTDEADARDRLPTSGPDTATYDRLRAVETTDEALLIYDTATESAWLQSSHGVALDDWR